MLVTPGAAMLIAADLCLLNVRDESANPKRRNILALCWACTDFLPSLFTALISLAGDSESPHSPGGTQNHHSIVLPSGMGLSQHHMPGTPGSWTPEGQVESKGSVSFHQPFQKIPL